MATRCGSWYKIGSMLFLLSPAKALDYDTPVPPTVQPTPPLFACQAAELIGVLRTQSPQQIAGLMHLSDALAVQLRRVAVLHADGDSGQRRRQQRPVVSTQRRSPSVVAMGK